MEAYRDQYASVFRNGRGVTILAISNDSPEALASWAADDDFPVLFGSDPEGNAAEAFGVGRRGNGMVQSRAVVIVDPEGRVSFATSRFREIDPTAYDELAAAVASVAMPLEADDDFPVLFGSDPEGNAAEAFGVGRRGNGMVQSRAVVIVDPEGRVSFATSRFREIDPTAYDELAAAVAAVALPVEADND